jgi:hypothetical protein
MPVYCMEQLDLTISFLTDRYDPTARRHASVGLNVTSADRKAPRRSPPIIMFIYLATVIIILVLIGITHALPMPDIDLDTTSQATQTASFDPMQSPTWLHAATVPLVCYDIVAIGAFCWLYACGYMAWMRHNEATERRVEEMHMLELQMRGGRRPGRATMIEGEMRRLGIF